LIITVTQALANDLRQWGGGNLKTHLVHHASSLPRIPSPPQIHLDQNRQIILGYIGTIDTYRGVDDLLRAMKILPNNYRLRLVGRIAGKSHVGKNPVWLDNLLQDPEINSKVEIKPFVPLKQVVEQIDQCDIVLQPASEHIITVRYASPIKTFDYMVRGKPIVAADVPCHREVLKDGYNACLFHINDINHLAQNIQNLVENPRLAQKIAHNAWQQSTEFNYDIRAKKILRLVGNIPQGRDIHNQG
jgi:glycosyltransferase involved in cell wall biosynthesis